MNKENQIKIFLIKETLKAMKQGLYNDIKDYVNEARILCKRLGEVIFVPDGWQSLEKELNLIRWIADGRYQNLNILKQALKSV